MGMEGFAERARRELMATGEKVRKRSVVAVEEFTPQEVQIARLARDGRTNPEIGAQLFLVPGQSSGISARCSLSSTSPRDASSPGRSKAAGADDPRLGHHPREDRRRLEPDERPHQKRQPDAPPKQRPEDVALPARYPDGRGSDGEVLH